MLYELIAVVRPGNLHEVKEVARATGNLVLRSNGVVRGLTNWGPFRLPRSISKHQSRYTVGHYFIMRFDSSTTVQEEVRRQLGLDPRMVRFSVVKLGANGGKKSDLQGIKDIAGTVDWGRQPALKLNSPYE